MTGENTEPRAAPEIGRILEEARRSRGLSLWQVEQETRIRSRYLRDLEREDFDVLPAVYVLGSLKTYADFLGLDGAALSRSLKPRLVEPIEPGLPAQRVGPGEAPDDEYEAVPASAVGFDRLFLGMGVILISILAIMTAAAAATRGDRSPVSQIDQPAISEAPSGIALVGNVQDEDNAKEDGDLVRNTDENREDRPEEPETSKNGEDEEDGEDQDDGEARDVPQAASFLDGVEFSPTPPPSSTTASAASTTASAASASASPAPSSSASSSSASSSPASATAGSGDSSPFPAPAGTGASPGPADGNPGAVPAPSYAPAAAPTGPDGGERRPSPRATAPGAGPISAEVGRRIDEAFERNGLD